MALTLYYAPQTRSVRALWMLDELGVECERIVVDLAKGEHKQPDYLAINPAGKVPALVDGDARIFESAAICSYLAERFADKGLCPAIGDPDRGAYLSWMFYSVGVIEPAFADRIRGAQDSPRVAWSSADRVMAVLAGALDPGPFLLGGRFSAADVMVGSILGWLSGNGVLTGDGSDRLNAYIGRLSERPAFPFKG